MKAPADEAVQMGRQRFPILPVAARDSRKCAHFHSDRRKREKPKKMREKSHSPVPENQIAIRFAERLFADFQVLDHEHFDAGRFLSGMIRRFADQGLQKSGFEGQDLFAVPCRRLWKKHDGPSIPEGLLDRRDLIPELVATSF